MGTVINFQVLVVNMIASLKPYAINLTKNMDDAHDLLQETVYRALTNHEKYIEGTNLKAWLFTIMKNIFINNYRRAAKRNTLIAPSPKYSTTLSVPPFTVKIPATFKITSLALAHPFNLPVNLIPINFGIFSSQGKPAITSQASAPPTPIAIQNA